MNGFKLQSSKPKSRNGYLQKFEENKRKLNYSALKTAIQDEELLGKVAGILNVPLVPLKKKQKRDYGFVENLNRFESVKDKSTVPMLIPKPKKMEKLILVKKLKKVSMYKNFLSKPEAEAARWRPYRKQYAENLNGLAQQKTDKIIDEFMQWLAEKFPPESPITKKEIEFLFGIMTDNVIIDTHAETLNAVNQKLAERYKLQQLSESAMLYKQIHRDLTTNHLGTSAKAAFGSRIPCSLRKSATGNENATKWIKCGRVPEDLETMAAVWKGIEDLRTTKGFCEFLKKKLGMGPPKYLRDYDDNLCKRTTSSNNMIFKI